MCWKHRVHHNLSILKSRDNSFVLVSISSWWIYSPRNASNSSLGITGIPSIIWTQIDDDSFSPGHLDSNRIVITRCCNDVMTISHGHLGNGNQRNQMCGSCASWASSEHSLMTNRVYTQLSTAFEMESQTKIDDISKAWQEFDDKFSKKIRLRRWLYVIIKCNQLSSSPEIVITFVITM